MNRSEALMRVRINHDLLTQTLTDLRELQEKLHRTIDLALDSHIEVERYLTLHEKAKE